MAKDEKKVLAIGKQDKENAEGGYYPFLIALTAAARGYDATVYMMWGAVEFVKKGVADNITAPNSAGLSETIKDAMDAGVKVFVCSRSCTERGIDSEDQLIDGVKMGGMFELIDIVDESDIVLEF